MPRALTALAALIATLTLGGLLSATQADAWQYEFQDFFEEENGGLGSSYAEASRCGKDKLGVYRFQSRTEGRSGDIQVVHRVRAKLPVTRNWRQLRDVELSMQVPDDFDPDVTAEILRGFGEFYDHMWVRWRPGRLIIRHPGVTIFGAEVVAPDEFKRKFKPKPGC